MRVWARAAVVLWTVAVLGSLAAVAALANRRGMLREVLESPDRVPIQEVDRSDQLVRLTVLSTLAVLLIAAIALIGWMYVCARAVDEHLPADSLRHRPGWAIGGWFVPFLSFVRPPQVLGDLWRTESRQRGDRERIILIGCWWALFLVGTVVGGSGGGGIGPTTVSGFRAQDKGYMIGIAVEAVWAALTILVIVGATRRVSRAVEAARGTSPDTH